MIYNNTRLSGKISTTASAKEEALRASMRPIQEMKEFLRATSIAVLRGKFSTTAKILRLQNGNFRVTCVAMARTNLQKLEFEIPILEMLELASMQHKTTAEWVNLPTWPGNLLYKGCELAPALKRMGFIFRKKPV